MNLDGQGSAQFFGGIIAAMSILPIALPLVMRAYIQMYGSLEMRMLVKVRARAVDIGRRLPMLTCARYPFCIRRTPSGIPTRAKRLPGTQRQLSTVQQ